MRAIRVHEFGGPEVLRLEEVAEPRPGPGQVLVRLRAAGVNPVDAYIRSGAFGARPGLPYVPGSDGAGEVVATGPGTEGLRPGDRVYVAGAPTYAELVAAPAEVVWPLPASLSFEQGAAVGIPYRTAYIALHSVGGARPGDRVLVRGGSGAVGVATIQLALAHGCSVVATAGTEEGRELVRAQGAVALPHDDAGGLAAAAEGRGYDVIVEMRAEANLRSDLELVAPGGCVAVVGSRGETAINPGALMARSASLRGVQRVSPDEARRVHLALGAGLRNGTLVPVVGRRFPLAQAAEAHAAVLAPGARGKVVLTIGA